MVPVQPPDLHRHLLVGRDGPRLQDVVESACGDDFALYHNDTTVYAADLRTGETWELTADTDAEWYSLTGDGQYVYSCVPWDEYQACWRLVYEDGHPVALTLLDEDITK